MPSPQPPGATVVAAARDPRALAALAARDRSIRTETADAAREESAGELIGRYQPDLIVVGAGAVPAGMPLQDYTWEAFSRHWEADVKITFGWLKAALLAPLRPGSRVIVISSGAAVFGSPVSGGYAGARPPSSSSRPTPPRSRSGPASASPSPPSCPR